MDEINSHKYWENRFMGNWEALGGSQQTRFFGRLAAHLMPLWFKQQVSLRQLRVCDWGCGQGEAVPELASALGVPVDGVDFSDAAIETARLSSAYSFYAEDWLSGGADSRTYDVVFSSNTLEHFYEPWHVFDVLRKHARSFVVLLLPYREEELGRHDEHFHSFVPEDFKLVRDGWSLVHAAVMDVSETHGEVWNGEQILVIYAHPDEMIQLNQLSIGEMTLDGRVLAHNVGDEHKHKHELHGTFVAIAEQLQALREFVDASFLAAEMARVADHGFSEEMSTEMQESISGLRGDIKTQLERLLDELTTNRYSVGVIESLQEKLGDVPSRLTHIQQQLQVDRGFCERSFMEAMETASIRHASVIDAISLQLESMHNSMLEARLAEEKSSERAGLLGDVNEQVARFENIFTDRMKNFDALIVSRFNHVEEVATKGFDALKRHDADLQASSNADLLRALTMRIDQVMEGRQAEIDDAQIASDSRMASVGEEILEKIDSKIQFLNHWHEEVLRTRQEMHLVEQQLQAMREDRDSIELASTREVETLRQRNYQLATMIKSYNAMLGSRSWRWTHGIRKMIAFFERRDVATFLPVPEHMDSANGAVGNSINKAHSDFAIPADLPKLAPPVSGRSDVYVWSVIDWHFRIQRPQHLARALADAGHRVFYISNNFIDSTKPGFSLEPIDGSDRLFQVNLNLAGAPPIYFNPPDKNEELQLRASLAALLGWTHGASSVSLVQHPYWLPMVRVVPNAKVVYDCMDHHAGFETSNPAVLSRELELIDESDLVIVTSDFLMHEVASRTSKTAMIRNAGEFELFSQKPASVFNDNSGRRIIGYYGAIAEWFDGGLIRKVAENNKDCLILLVGADTAGVGEQLKDLSNVVMVGEVPYSDLPYYLYAFDVALLPFKVIPLTLATNPVKVYEYLASGVPVVAVDLPEIAQFQDLVYKASTDIAFLDAIQCALNEPDGLRTERISFAREQTWAHRARALEDALDNAMEPKVSVIVLTYNNWAFTDACLFSIEHYSDYRNLEVIVVDNASSDESQENLQKWVSEQSNAGHVRRLFINDDNLGFSAGNNVGLAAATGDYFVILNNDTYVTPGWVRGLTAHLRRNPGAGMVGPVTNNIGNEARVQIAYESMEEMIVKSGTYTRSHAGISFEIPTLAFFCVMMRRSTYETVGPMDEKFGVGFFEDDDYCRRVEQCGLKNICADDVFVHHHLSASFDALKAERKAELFRANKEIYEQKWGAWVAHNYRADVQ